MTDFEELAQIVDDEHALSSRVESWRECQRLLCFRAQRIERDMQNVDAG